LRDATLLGANLEGSILTGVIISEATQRYFCLTAGMNSASDIPVDRLNYPQDLSTSTEKTPSFSTVGMRGG